ncbi:Disease resistance protein [Acorus gramineus]|uniref:Disease resistance protein n=1 Tax=Acorus gramineus TaxID=55184 RepID=A0AAV9AAN9_ACOGR|nr:Disease resistance protein [Acorus gramineus]
MGGVGKTTLVRTLNNKLEDSSSPQLFDIVIWITVSKGTDEKTIQYRLVERLKMSTSMTESTEGRAIRLCERLKKEKKILLILDDVWEKIDLDKVGIPHGDAHPGCKIILTTRSFDVCREMETDKEMKVNVLSEEDAWKMFSKEIKSHAKDVSKECGGLPLALITVGKAMREKEQPELWKNALDELRRSAPDIRGVEREVFLPLKLSYDSLQGKNIKPCFLYCIMYPEDHSIKVSELVHCWMAEGLIDESDDLEVLFNRGFAVVKNLIDSCMLERGDEEEEVKMHDVVRDVAIWIASSSEPEFETFARPGTGLTNFPKESMKESLRRVSLMNNKIEKLPPDRLMTNSKLLSFLLQGNPLRDIPEELFVGLRALRVLNLSSTRLKKLPLSLGSLGDLRALFLGNCEYLTELPHLGELKKLLVLDVRNTGIRELPHSLRSLGDLRALFLAGCDYLEKLPHLGEFKKLAVLDLNGTDIRELPDGMEELCNLRQLNLSYTDKLVNIQAGVFARLSRLEELEMQHSAYKWDVSGPQSMGRATFNELGSLMHLHLLYIDLENVACLSLDLSWLKKLKKFRICVGERGGPIWCLITNYERVVELHSIDLSGEARFDELLANASALWLSHCRGIRSICELVESGTRAFIGLKSLAIWLCDEMTCVIKGELVQESILPNLEELNLGILQNLEYIVEGMIPDGESLTKLRIISVLFCPALQCLFTSALLPHVQSLEKIKLFSCSGMSVLIPTEVNVADFSKVRVLDLEKLPNLKAVSKNPLAWPSLEHLIVYTCPKLKNVIRIDNQNPIREIRGDAEWSLICPGYTT